MCVIIIADDGKRPDGKMLEQAFQRNNDGAGCAWREESPETGEMEVVWSKGITDIGYLKDLVASLPEPFVVHCRIASCGGVQPELTHPFAIEDTQMAHLLDGRTKGHVLFHNGHWSGWNSALMSSTAQTTDPRFKLPAEGRYWSDTRAMAHLVNIHGIGLINLIEEKAVYFGPQDYEILVGRGWTKVNGMWCSNDFFVNTYSSGNSSQVTCKDRTCYNRNLDSSGYCPNHTKLNKSDKDDKEDPQRTKAGGTPSPDESDDTGKVHGAAQGSQGVSQPETPFLSLTVAEKQHREGTVGKKQIKRVRALFQQGVGLIRVDIRDRVVSQVGK